MPAALSRKIKVVFVTQTLVAALLVTVGTIVGAGWLTDRIMKEYIAQEMAQTWERIAQDAAVELPQNLSWRTYYVATGSDDSAVPEWLRQLPPGMHRGQDQYRYVKIEQRPQGRLFLLSSPTALEQVVRAMSLLAIVLSLLAITLVSWLGYRRCKRVVAPVTLLAREVGDWDPRVPDRHDFDAAGRSVGERSNEVGALRQALGRMASRVDAHMRRESNFTRDASHEFRTPLTVIRMAADLLGHEDQVSTRGQRSLRRIGDASREMEDLLDALLLLARDPSIPVECEEVAVLDEVHEQIAALQDQLGDKPVRIDLDIGEVPCVQAPPRVLGVMLGHLLRNALAFTEAGRVVMRVRNDRIVVSDTGIGMDQQTLEQVFEPFWRADISRQGPKGMGLPIVQRLAQRLGWQVVLQSAPGSGTEASIIFAESGQAQSGSRPA